MQLDGLDKAIGLTSALSVPWPEAERLQSASLQTMHFCAALLTRETVAFNFIGAWFPSAPCRYRAGTPST
jgi:hypothetical protein